MYVMKKARKKGTGFRFPLSISLCIAICMVVFIGTLIMGEFLPSRTYIVITLIMGGVSSVASIVFGVMIARKSISTKGLFAAMIAFAAFFTSFIAFGEKGFIYTFIDEPFLPFWEISLIVGFLFSGFFIIICGRRGKLWAKIVGLPLLALVFAVVGIMFMSHLNYVLDFHEPVECTARIEEKTIYIRPKSDSYHFKVTVDGETFDLEVDSIEYEKYEEGDVYSFEKYQGAFGKAFYVSD